MIEQHDPRRVLSTTKLDEWLARRVLAGLHPKAIAAASGGEVSVRTAYRWRRDLRGLERVQAGQYEATFILHSGRPPTQLTPWTRIPGSVREARQMAGQRCGRYMPIARELCARFGGHRSQCKGRRALDDAARVERERRAQRRRARQREGLAA